MAETFARRLRRLREGAAMSQADLADASGIPVATIRGWEQGRREPLASGVCALVEALGVSADALLGCYQGWDERPPKKRG